jgi:hypothetical protein
LPVNDIIFKAIPFDIIPCSISYTNEAINFRNIDSTSASINKENILAIVRRNGTHEIIRDITEVAPILNSNQEDFERLISKQNDLSINQNPNTPKPIVQPVPNNQTIEEKLEPKTIVNKPKLTTDEKTKYSKQSVDNILVFKDYLGIIGDKRRSLVEKQEASKSALALFSPGATIEVSSKNKPGTRRLPVETYLRNLSNLNYTSIQIEYANLKFISELSQANDGSYYGIVSGEQTFVGFDEKGNQMYSDVVDKNYKIKVESYKAVQSGVAETKWKVLLGDVSLSQ